MLAGLAVQGLILALEELPVSGKAATDTDSSSPRVSGSGPEKGICGRRGDGDMT